jgi:hypothetical protein
MSGYQRPMLSLVKASKNVSGAFIPTEALDLEGSLQERKGDGEGGVPLFPQQAGILGNLVKQRSIGQANVA